MNLNKAELLNIFFLHLGAFKISCSAELGLNFRTLGPGLSASPSSQWSD